MTLISKNDTGPSFKFTETYWGADKSTRVIFEPGETLPDTQLVTSCFVFAVVDGASVVMAKPKRGWGLPGGHREPGEDPEQCARREVYEEAAIKLGDLTLVGWWRTSQLFVSEHNSKYPAEGYQLLYTANVLALDTFIPKHEVSERAVVPFGDMHDFHHNTAATGPILDYALHTLSL